MGSVKNPVSGRTLTKMFVSRYQPDGLMIPLKIPKPERARVLLQSFGGVGQVIGKMVWPKHVC
jgi:hypothetical protein